MKENILPVKKNYNYYSMTYCVVERCGGTYEAL